MSHTPRGSVIPCNHRQINSTCLNSAYLNITGFIITHLNRWLCKLSYSLVLFAMTNLGIPDIAVALEFVGRTNDGKPCVVLSQLYPTTNIPYENSLVISFCGESGLSQASFPTGNHSAPCDPNAQLSGNQAKTPTTCLYFSFGASDNYSIYLYRNAQDPFAGFLEDLARPTDARVDMVSLLGRFNDTVNHVSLFYYLPQNKGSQAQQLEFSSKHLNPRATWNGRELVSIQILSPRLNTCHSRKTSYFLAGEESGAIQNWTEASNGLSDSQLTTICKAAIDPSLPPGSQSNGKAINFKKWSRTNPPPGPIQVPMDTSRP